MIKKPPISNENPSYRVREATPMTTFRLSPPQHLSVVEMYSIPDIYFASLKERGKNISFTPYGFTLIDEK
jgi:hypothetical protein